MTRSIWLRNSFIGDERFLDIASVFKKAPCISAPVPFETIPMFVLLTMALSYPFKKDRLALPLSTPLSSRKSMVWCLWLVPAGSVSSSSTPQTFRGASHLWGLLCPPVWLLCPPVYLLGRFPSLRHAQGSTPTGVFEGGCRPLTYSNLGFPFHFSLLVASSSNQWRIMACVIRLSLFKATQSEPPAWVTASTSIVKLEAETV